VASHIERHRFFVDLRKIEVGHDELFTFKHRLCDVSGVRRDDRAFHFVPAKDRRRCRSRTLSAGRFAASGGQPRAQSIGMRFSVTFHAPRESSVIMKNKVLVLRSLSSLFLWLSYAAAQNTPLPKPQIASAVGQIAPDFSLADQEKNQFHLAEHRGKRVLLIFYRGYWCPYCVAQLRDFARHKPEFGKLNVQLVAISVDDPEHAGDVWKKVVSKQFPVLSDSGAQVIRKYGILDTSGKGEELALRTAVLIGEDGREQWRRVSKSVEDIPKAADFVKKIRAEQ
jgi:peroxiredoxin